MTTYARVPTSLARQDEEWDDSVDRLGGSPFVRPGWVRAWWRSFGTGSLELLTLRSGGEVRALVPIRRTRSSVWSPANWHTPEFDVPAEDEDARREVLHRLLQQRPPRLTMRFVPPALAEQVADVALQNGYRVLVRVLEHAPYLPLGDHPTRLERDLSTRFRSELRRRSRRLQQRGRLTYEVHDGTERLDHLLTEGFAVEAAGWKGRSGTAMGASPVTEAFYRDVSRWAASRGWLRLGFLRLDGRPLAFDLALEVDGRALLVKTGYDPAFRADAPGQLLRERAITGAADRGMHTYDFLGTDEPWKLVWTRATQARVQVQAFRDDVAGTAAWMAYSRARPVVKSAVDALAAARP